MTTIEPKSVALAVIPAQAGTLLAFESIST
jgi:1,4-dihydroxy-2-naphthoate octaprenyltransferase